MVKMVAKGYKRALHLTLAFALACVTLAGTGKQGQAAPNAEEQVTKLTSETRYS
jgi:hypothetical protein